MRLKIIISDDIKTSGLVGVLFGLTDYAFWLYVTDLGVDRTCTHQGIGRLLGLSM